MKLLIYSLTLWALMPGACQICIADDNGAHAGSRGYPPFCGPLAEHHQVLKVPEDPGPSPLSAGKARVHIFWRGSRVRSWAGTQCKVALNGTWVAALSKNTYSVIDVAPGKLRFCGASNHLKPTWRSLLFLYAAEGQTYYLECSPGGDIAGASEPTLSEMDNTAGNNVISRLQLAAFRLRERR